jgi:ubiquinone/menaquinone biosynthesis C-methylase UbiE
VARGHRLLDVGAGPGFFALPAAARVAPEGLVIACDISAEMLHRLSERAEAAGCAAAILLVRCEEAALPLHDRQCDRALLANVLHEAAAPVGLLAEVRRVLRPGGRLLVVDWKPEATEMGPPAAERLAPDQAAAFLREAGFEEVVPADAGPFHFGLLARTAPA